MIITNNTCNNFSVAMKSKQLHHFKYLNLQTFNGNYDSEDIVENSLDPPIAARFLRVLPGSLRSEPEMRLELYGCPLGRLCTCMLAEL